MDFNKNFECIKAFGLDRSQQLDPNDFINTLWRMCDSGMELECQIVGYYECCLCNKACHGKSEKLGCGHELHASCLRERATALTDETMDPVLLAQLACPRCDRPLASEELSRIVGQQYIDQKMAEANLKLMRTIEFEERAARKK